MRYRYSKNKNGKLEKTASIWTKEEHKINLQDVDPLAVYICEKLNNEGFETYIVGGAVRDLLLKKVPKDFDIASRATPSKIKKIFGNSRIIGKRFRLVHVFFGEKIFEIATFRSIEEGTQGNSFGTIEDDVKRRDFTLNALFYDPKKEIIVDFVGGFNDINDKKLRPIIPMKVIFEEDPVRMIRAVKYSVMAGFAIPFFMRQKIKNDSHLLKRISPSRLTEELSKILKSPDSAEIVLELFNLRLYYYLQPHAARLLEDSDSFKKRYLKSLSDLNKGDDYLHTLTAGLQALITDYVDDNVDWSTMEPARYKEVFFLSRKFVLPMNPPRLELSRAVKNLFAAHNITVKLRHTRF